MPLPAPVTNQIFFSATLMSSPSRFFFIFKPSDMTRAFLFCLLSLIPLDTSGAQAVVPQGTWGAKGSNGLTLVGTWTAVPDPTSGTVTGTWTLVNAQGSTVANGGWSASKSPDGWVGNWRAANFGGSEHEFSGSWRSGVDLKENGRFADLFEKAGQTIVTGSWRSGSNSGAWSIRAEATAKTTPPTSNPGKSEMGPMLSAFRAASHPPEEKELLGRWLLVKEIDQDHVLFDERGVRDTTSGHPYRWELTVTLDYEGRLIGASRTTWTGPETSRIEFKAREVTFSKDHGGNAPYRYRCRMPAADRLICIIDKPDPGHAVEFRKVR